MDAQIRREVHGMHPRGKLERFQPVATSPALGAGPDSANWTPVGKQVKTRDGKIYRVTARILRPIDAALDHRYKPETGMSLSDQGYSNFVQYVVREINEAGAGVGVPKSIRVYFRPLKPDKK